MADRIPRRPAPRTLSAQPPAPLRTPQPASVVSVRLPTLAALLAGGALVPGCYDPECASTRAGELDAHGREALREASNGRAADTLRELGVAMGVVAHRSTAPRMQSPGEAPSITTMPPVPEPPMQPSGGIMPVDPTPPVATPPPEHLTTTPRGGGGAVRPVSPTHEPRILAPGRRARVTPAPPEAPTRSDVDGGMRAVTPTPIPR